MEAVGLYLETNLVDLVTNFNDANAWTEQMSNVLLQIRLRYPYVLNMNVLGYFPIGQIMGVAEEMMMK